MTLNEAERIIEGLIFASSKPISSAEIGEIVELEKEAVQVIIEKLMKEKYNERSGLMIRFVAGGYQLVTRPEISPWIDRLGRPVIQAPLSTASMETLAIIAYEQPITKSEIEKIRGVRSDSALNTLIDRELVTDVGRKDGPGRPLLYGTTDVFLEQFGLDSLNSLPDKKLFEDEKNKS
ncbi:MAG: SMC-Scp complex subunit ScpB [Firmicutes bacterium]|nr:SMC-Scp complex subunit ScpB [Bacillota bacterium]